MEYKSPMPKGVEHGKPGSWKEPGFFVFNVLMLKNVDRRGQDFGIYPTSPLDLFLILKNCWNFVNFQVGCFNLLLFWQ